MSRPCPNCGTAVASDARFCRLCGTPLKAAVTKGEPVSPRAETVPLSEEGKTTRGLAAEDGGADTHRVGRAEMESLLRRPSSPPASRQESDNEQQPVPDAEAFAAPATSALAAAFEASAAPEDSPSSNIQASTESAAHDSKKEASAAVVAATNERRGAESPAKTKTNPSARRMWQVAALSLLFVAVGATVLAFYYSRRTSTRGAGGPAEPISISDQKRLVEEKLTEAESLLAAGNVTDAIARLRYIIKLDPSNARAHRMLAEALERTGDVNGAIDEYRVATQNDARNEETWLRYADALRRVGRTDEAREIYQKLSSSESAEVARTAKEQLAALPPASSSQLSSDQARDARAQNRAEENVANSSSTSPPASTLPRPGSPSASSNSNGAGNARSKNDPVASYTTAIKIIEGKNIKKMDRADLIRAYELFQYAQKGPNASDATRHLRELDKELFERRKRKQ